MKLSKTPPIFITAILCATLAFGQECENEISEDKFTKVKTTITKPVVVSKGLKVGSTVKIKTISWKVKEEGDSRFLLTSYQFLRGMVMMQGIERIILLLDNEETLSLNITSSTPSLEGKITTYELEFSYNLTSEDLAKLVEHQVKDARVEAMANGFDFSISEKVSTKGIFKCIE